MMVRFITIGTMSTVVPCQCEAVSGSEGHLPAIWPLLINKPHIGHLRVLFQGRRRGL
jgi:hypothetical protein